MIFNSVTERFYYLVITLEQQDLDFDELTASLIKEAERYPASPESGMAYMAKRERTVSSLRKLSCFYCGQMGHVKATYEVKKYRMEKYSNANSKVRRSSRIPVLGCIRFDR